MNLEKDILNRQIKSLLQQFVTNGFFNIVFPISGRTDYWARTHWGHHEECTVDRSPVVGFYNFRYSEDFRTICTSNLNASISMFLKASCDEIKGNEDDFYDLAFQISRACGIDNRGHYLPGTYTLTDSENNSLSYTGAKLHDLGITNLSLSSWSPLKVQGGKILQYQGILNMGFVFENAPIELSRKTNLITA